MPPDRPHGPDPHQDHHLWRNGRLWWVAFTVHLDNWTAERVRRSLRTADLAEARRRRDAMLASYAAKPSLHLSLRHGATVRKGG